MQNTDDKAFLEDFVGMANWRINDLDPGLCPSALPFMRSTKIELVPRFFEVHNTQHWDCPSDFSSCPFSGAGFYLKDFVDSLNNISGCPKTISILVPCESEGWEQFLGELPGESNPSCCYRDYWCAELPTSDPAHLKDPMSSVLRNLYLKYRKFRNGIFFQGAQHNWTETRQWLLDSGAVLAHEVFHNLDLLDQYTCNFDIMHNSGKTDKRTLYPIDVGKMHRALSVTNARQFADIYQNYNVNREVIADETWDADMRIYQNVVVKPGATLTVKCTLRLGKNVSISVERGAKLLIDGGFLTNALDCQEEDWQGIYVWGNSDIEQPEPTGSPVAGKAGIVEVKNKSIIEHAVTAISTRAPFLSWADQQRHWGGVIRVHESTLRNNKRDVEFMSYKFPNKSSFTNSTFTEIGDWRDNTDGITIWDCNNIEIRNCTFDNLDRFGVIGIDYFGSVGFCNIKNIDENGLVFLSTKPLAKHIFLNGNDFNSNFIDAQIDGIHSYVEFNKFTNSSSGLILEGIQRYGVDHNVFTNEPLGTTIQGTQTSLGFATCNTFTACDEGINYYGKNSGSVFLGNTFQTSTHDVGVGFAGVNGEIASAQKYLADKEATNCFSTNTANHIFTEPNRTVTFDYLDFKLDISQCSTPEGNLTFGGATTNNYRVLKGLQPGRSCEITARQALSDDPVDGYEEEFAIAAKIDAKDYVVARQLLLSYLTNTSERQEFKDIQMINLAMLESNEAEYILNFSLDTRLREIANSFSPMSAYARALLMLLTREFIHPYLGTMASSRSASSLSERQAGLKPKTPITIAPNPNDGSFMLRFEGRPVKNGTFILVDMYGKELLNSPIHTLGYDDIFIDATAIKNGMYYAKIMEGQYAIWESKIIILEK